MLQDADGHVVTSVAGVAPKAAISVRVADGRVHATTTRTELLEERRWLRRPTSPQDELSYEAAREELVETVRRLEAGGTTLEESLALWERGEQLATICQQWLDGVRKRLDETLEKDDDADELGRTRPCRSRWRRRRPGTGSSVSARSTASWSATGAEP